MLYTVLPEETALVRYDTFCIHVRVLICVWGGRYCGITRAVQLVVYVLHVNVCIGWETYFQTIYKTSMNVQMSVGQSNFYASKK